MNTALRGSRLFALAALAALGTSSAQALVIDDFSEGDVLVTGKTVQDQTGLDPASVIGGARRLDVGRFGEGSRLEIADDRLGFSSSPGMGYFTLTYGAVDPLGNVDFTQDGHDRLRVRYGDVVGNGHLAGIYINLSPGSTGNGVGWSAGEAWDDIIIEIPYASFPTSLTAVERIAVDVLRNLPGTIVEIDSIASAGPSVEGDFDRDGVVNGGDLTEWTNYFGVTTSTGALQLVFASADASGNGRVDGADFLAWQRALPAPQGAASVPEPSAGVVALAGVAALAAYQRARRS